VGWVVVVVEVEIVVGVWLVVVGEGGDDLWVNATTAPIATITVTAVAMIAGWRGPPGRTASVGPGGGGASPTWVG
jgi:hypothetical protein